MYVDLIFNRGFELFMLHYFTNILLTAYKLRNCSLTSLEKHANKKGIKYKYVENIPGC